MPWRVFGPGRTPWDASKPVCDQLFHCERPDDPRSEARKFWKSLFRDQSRFGRVGVHFPISREDRKADLEWVTADGASVRSPDFDRQQITFDVAQVNHYALRSLDSYLLKRDRGRANHSHHTLGLAYWRRFDLAGDEDKSILRYRQAREDWIDKMRADRRVARMSKVALNWHRDRLKALRQRPDIQALEKGIRRIADRAAPPSG